MPLFAPLLRLVDQKLACVTCGGRGAGPHCAPCKEAARAPQCTPAGLPIWALGPYLSLVGERVRRLKFQDQTVHAFSLGAALASIARALPPGAQLVPVPLHPARLSERGYNQSALIAAQVARRTGHRMRTDLLLRIKDTQAQATLDLSARRENLQDAFFVHTKAAPQRIILLDDVVTSGNTIDSAHRVLSERGHEVLGVLACARADRPGALAAS